MWYQVRDDHPAGALKKPQTHLGFTASEVPPEGELLS
ncbi:MAG: hypothetical protein ACI93T_000800, partial [Porticoccaceae bacterium]